MDKKQLKPYADISVVTGKYTKDGKERNRYHKIGTVFASPHLSNMTIKLDSAPLTSEGWLKVFVRDDWQGYRPSDKPEDDKLLAEDYANKQRIKGTLDQSDIPF